MNILCFGDSNTFGISPIDGKRLGDTERWPALLKQQLGGSCHVIEAGQPNRTLVNNPPFDGDKSGIKYLKPYLETKPIDVIIIQLGTNDLKARFNLTPLKISEGLTQLVLQIKEYYHASNKLPKIIILSPPKVYEVAQYQKIYAGAAQKSQLLSHYFTKVAQLQGCEILDCYRFIETCYNDGIHISTNEHKKLANELTSLISPLIE